MTTAEMLTLALGALNAVLLVALLLRRPPDVAAAIEALRAETRAQADGTRDALARSEAAAATAARDLRTEVGASLARLGDELRAATSERLQMVADAVEAARKAQSDAAGTLRAELLGGFGTLGDGMRDGLAAGTRAQGERLDGFAKQLGDARSAAADEAKGLREEVRLTLKALGDGLKADLEAGAKAQGERLKALADEIRLASGEAAKAQEGLRGAVETRLDKLRQENADKLEAMRATVDEKLQATLETRLSLSFQRVSEDLQRVHESVGEMQVLATGVGDLKRVLSNVKMRGTWGETTLGSLLEQSLASDQFRTNVEVVPGTGARVEYAIRLPGDNGGDPVWLPIDCKLPMEDYERLTQAAERADQGAVEEAVGALERRIKACAKDICSKYIHVPHTTDFAVMFLPTEGLFAEVVRRPGLVDTIQTNYRVIVAGPTTLMALLSSLRMGFRTLAIQKRSSEIQQVLGAVKTEFGKFGDVLDKVHKKLGEAQSEVEKAGVRRRAVDRSLRNVEALPEAQAGGVLALTTELNEEFDAG